MYFKFDKRKSLELNVNNEKDTTKKDTTKKDKIIVCT